MVTDTKRPWWKRLVFVGPLVLVLGLTLACAVVYKLRPKPTGYLSIAANIESEVFVNGNIVGSTPLKKFELPVGKHEIKVREVQSGKTKRYKTNIEAEKLSRLKVSWPKATVRAAHAAKGIGADNASKAKTTSASRGKVFKQKNVRDSSPRAEKRSKVVAKNQRADRSAKNKKVAASKRTKAKKSRVG